MTVPIHLGRVALAAGLVLGFTAFLVAVTTADPARAQAPEPPRTVLVLDASGSMWQQIAGGHKITIAREVVGELLGTLPADQTLGLWAYGHNRKGDCADIEELVPAGTGNRDAIRAAVEGLNPKGKTPLSDAVRRAAEALRYEENAATVVLISDGRETCDRDPCAVAEALEAAGIDFTAHVIGFDVDAPEDQAQLRCLAENTGGTFRTADDAGSLQEALFEVTAAPESEPEPAPQPEPETPAPEVTLTAPATAPAGSRVAVSWDPTVTPRDYVTIVPRGTPDDEIGSYKRASSRDQKDQVQAPSDPGLYEIRYVLNEGRRVLARAPLELTNAAVTLTAPETAPAGSRVPVSWDPTVDVRDYVTIVPMGTPDDEVGSYKRASSRDQKDQIQAPGEPGLYEIRYVLNEGRRVLARAPLELTNATVTLTAPETAPAGSRVPVSWDPTVGVRDYVTIVPMGTPDDEVGSYKRASSRDQKDQVQAPGEPGLYEVRYVLNEGRRVLARAPLEIVPLSATVTAPGEVVAGAALDVSWDGPGRRDDRVELVPAEAPPDAAPLEAARADRDDSARFTAPDDAGSYAVRYRLGETGAILGSADVAVISVAASLNAPDTAAPGETIRVRWTGPGGERDRIAVAAPDQGPFQWLAATGVKTDEGDGVALTLPGTPGSYELRYVDVANGAVLATRQIEAR
ncbi:VWA domain-containing protein [uncultured Rhodospira sp.]|uniref:vWA domain-containing protein n=1 Tax=uncultured Rhodospira sp. TaxID=1936189 RepID=UPI0026093600|nr:VWA domain-containing protein [uncultured Rhodospira sp.]